MNESSPPPPPSPSRLVHVSSVLCLLVGLALYEAFSDDWFAPPPGGGINWMRLILAALVGAVCGAIGYGVGILLDRLRR